MASPDPISFLHHTQIDRLWWLWQQANPSNRTNDYLGSLSNGNPASLTDIMPMMDLAANRAVETLCLPRRRTCATYMERERPKNEGSTLRWTEEETN
jgi:hypothetical protein